MWLLMLRICNSKILCLTLVGLLSACSGHALRQSAGNSQYLEPPADAPLAQASAQLLQHHPGQNGFSLLTDGRDALIARLLLAASAKQSLDLQYYLYHDDLSGSLLAWALLNAADRGVRVRLLLDDMASRNKDDYLRILALHPNVNIRLFNPFRREYSRDLQLLTRYGVSTRRMHNKAMVADNCVAIVGGRNIGDEYFDAATDAVVFGDLDVLTLGPVVSDVSQAFDTFWNHPFSIPVAEHLGEPAGTGHESLQRLRDQLQLWLDSNQQHPYAVALRGRADQWLNTGQNALFWGQAYVLTDSPQKISQTPEVSPLMLSVGGLLNSAQRRVILISPYFVPGEEGTRFLQALAQRGVELIILTNSLASTDVPAVHSAYKKYRQSLLKAGVQLYELDAKAGKGATERSWLGSSSVSLHAKALVVDDEFFYVGSMNFDPRSVLQNTEMGMLFRQPILGKMTANGFMQVISENAWMLSLQNGELRWSRNTLNGTVVREQDPRASVWRRLQSWVLGFLPIETEL